MQSQRRWTCVLGLLALGCLGDAAFALPHWKPKPSGPTTVYAPTVRHFVVVDPAPAVAAFILPAAMAPAPLPATAQNPSSCPPTAGEIVAPAVGAPLYAPRKGEHLKQALSPAQTQKIFWQQRVEPVPAYPWGWFGARRHTSHTAHRRFYEDQYDSKLLLGD
ncbi:MAG TPA: hypothetical protein VMV10_03660 [Pirellulales bacterium]|nr:hypothetical protein [Pirellulales bacterium]